jgi:hypothetical protein
MILARFGAILALIFAIDSFIFMNDFYATKIKLLTLKIGIK